MNASFTDKDHPLSHLPRLWQWYCSKQSGNLTDPAEMLLWNLTRGLLTPGRDGTKIWLHGIDAFLRTSLSPLEDFLTTESYSQELGRPLMEHFSSLAETAIRLGDGEKILPYMQRLADKVPLSAIRFIAAWTALNISDYTTCIEECEKEPEPNNPIYTLLGQALLESGRAPEAVDALTVAVRLDSNDVMSFFQLVKALLVCNRTQEATLFAEQCRQLAGPNIEVECLSAMVVVADRAQNMKFAEETMGRLMNFFREDPGNLDLMILAFDVADVSGNQNGLSSLFQQADLQKLARRPDFTTKISRMMRRLGEKGWFLMSKELTDRLIPFAGNVSPAFEQ